MSIQGQIWAGYAIAASVLGQTFSQYRPTGVTNPTAFGNLVQTLPAAFDASPTYKFSKPALYGKPERYALVDGSQCQVGDYFIGNGETLFIAEMPPLTPILAILCNVTLNVLRPASNSGVGAQPYGGDSVASEVPIMTGWPAAVIQGTKGEKGDTNLPGDIRMPWYSVLLPQWPGTMILSADVLTDNLGRRYKVSSAELSALGWRLTAMLSET